LSKPVEEEEEEEEHTAGHMSRPASGSGHTAEQTLIYSHYEE
jgi:hypothetical protein